jgi:alpha-tubulin suppressor-like RCC1 family protein
VRRTGGALACWGRNAEGQIGDGTNTQRNAPTPVMMIADAISVSAGTNHTCAARMAGGAVCWGANASGQIGDGTRTNRNVPTVVMGVP